MAEEKSNRGGLRQGAGRPVGSKSKVNNGRVSNKPGRKQVQISCQPEELEEIKRRASEAGKTVSSFLLDCALNHD